MAQTEMEILSLRNTKQAMITFPNKIPPYTTYGMLIPLQYSTTRDVDAPPLQRIGPTNTHEAI